MARASSIAVSIAFLLSCGAAAAADIVVKQLDRKFSMIETHAKVGDTLVFINEDPFVHNVFSLSDTQSFDLGSFRKGETRKIKLLKEGKVDVECAVHPGMQLSVDVTR